MVNFKFNSNFLVGRGKVVASTDQEKWFDFGNVPNFTYNLTVTTIEHKNSREALKKTDKEVTIDIVAESTIVLDSIHPENTRIFNLGSTISEATQAAITTAVSNDLFIAANGHWKNVSDDETGNFSIVRNLDSVVVQNSAEDTTYTEGSDYLLDKIHGLIMPLDSGSIGDGDNLHIDYTAGLQATTSVVGGKESLIERYVRFLGDPASGSILDIEAFANLTPDGDFGALGDDFTAYNIKAKFLDNSNIGGLLEVTDLGEKAVA